MKAQPLLVNGQVDVSDCISERRALPGKTHLADFILATAFLAMTFLAFQSVPGMLSLQETPRTEADADIWRRHAEAAIARLVATVSQLIINPVCIAHSATAA